MLPNVLRTDAADHVPVLAEEVRGLLDVQPGETVVDATFGAGGHSRLLVADLQGRGKLIAIDRDPTVPAVLRPDEGVRARRPDAVPARRLRGRPLAARGERRAGRRVLLDLGLSSMQVDRPERGFSYATDAPLDMRMDPSDEPERGRDRRTRGTSASSRPSSGATGRSATRGRSRAASSAAARRRRSSAPGSSSTSSAPRSRRRPASARGIPRSACSRRSGSRSTTSSSRSRPAFPPRSRCSARAGGSPSSASTRSRTGS